MNHDHEIQYGMTHGEIVNAINDSPINPLDYGDATLDASIEDDGTICISIITDCHVTEGVGDVIARGIVGLPLKLVREDESANVAWYKVLDA